MIQLAGNYLSGAILFSILWHVFWISNVDIVTTKKAIQPERYTEVAFLGPILEKTAFEMMVEDVKPRAETFYRSAIIIEEESRLDVSGPSRSSKNILPPGSVSGGSGDFSSKKYMDVRKDEPRYFLKGKKIFYHVKGRGQDSIIEGPAGLRAVILRPDMPAFNESLFMDEENFITKFKVSIAEDGAVNRVEPVISSGHPSIDMECVKYLKQWKFEPSGFDGAPANDWGVVTLKIKVR